VALVVVVAGVAAVVAGGVVVAEWGVSVEVARGSQLVAAEVAALQGRQHRQR
jgi:hypothetical protein